MGLSLYIKELAPELLVGHIFGSRGEKNSQSQNLYIHVTVLRNRFLFK